MRDKMRDASGGTFSDSSWRRRVMWLIATPAGGLALLLAAGQVLMADGTLAAASTSFAQAYLGIGGALLVLLDLAWLALGILFATTACGVAFTRQRVRIANVRSVFLAWPMIDGVTTVRVRRRLVPAVCLITGEVVPIRFAARIPASTPPDRVVASSAALSMISGALTRLSPGPASWLRPAGGRMVTGRLTRTRQLPGPVTGAVPRRGNPRLWRLALGRYAFCGALLGLLGVHAGAGDVVKLGIVGMTYSALFCLTILAVDSIRIRRRLVFGADFVAARPVLSRSWRVLPFASVTWAGQSSGLASGFRNVTAQHNIWLMRSDGRGLEIRRPELQAGATAPLLAAFRDSPAVTPEAVKTLTANLPAGEQQAH
jgi:hypothetical protein